MRILHINYSDSKGGAATSVRRLQKSFLKILKIYMEFFLHKKKKSQNHKFMITNFCDHKFVIL